MNAANINGHAVLQRHGSFWAYNCISKELVKIPCGDGQVQAYVNRNLKKVAIRPLADFVEHRLLSSITLSGECNMDCPYCFVYPVAQKRNMSPEDAVRALRALRRYAQNRLTVYAWGGEPTLNPRALIALCEEAERLGGITIVLTSNGVFSHQLFSELSAFHCVLYQLSFDGEKLQHRQKHLVNGADSLPIVVEKLAMLKQAEKRIALRTTVTRDNLEDLFGLVDFAKNYTKSIMVEHVHTYVGRSISQKALRPSHEGYAQLLLHLHRRAVQENVNLYALPINDIQNGFPDIGGFINVLPDMRLCSTNAIIDSSHAYASNMSLGVIEGETIRLDNKNIRRMRRNMKRNVGRICTNCIAYGVCHGRIHRDPFAIYPNCPSEQHEDRCNYYRAVYTKWLEEKIDEVSGA